VIRWLAILACALTVCITASSAFIRHSQAGLGCPDWPNGECVAGLRTAQADAQAGARSDGQPAVRSDAPPAAPPAAQPRAVEPGVRTARALHRVSAMLVGIFVLLLAVFGWSSMRSRVALAIALADTVFLAWLGRFTPHPVPLVTLANLVGGIALAAAFAWIAASLRTPARAGAPAPVPSPGADLRIGAATIAPAFAALALLAVAAWIGTMIGAHDAIGACEGARCAGSMRLDVGTLDALPDKLKDAPPADTLALFKQHASLAAALDAPDKRGGGDGILISEHEDELLSVEDDCGSKATPADYISGFEAFVRANMNAVPALIAATQRPRDLTRAELKQIAVLLDEQGYSEANLRQAYDRVRNADIAAHLIGFVRQAALGDPLVPYETRVENGVQKILASRDWSPVQKRWLQRIGRALKEQPVGDPAMLSDPLFAQNGGFPVIDQAFDHQLGNVLMDLNAAIWDSDSIAQGAA